MKKTGSLGWLGFGAMAVAAVGLLSVAAYAWPGGRGRGRGMGRGMGPGGGCPMMGGGMMGGGMMGGGMMRGRMGPGGPGGPGMGMHLGFMRNATQDQIAQFFGITKAKAAQLVAARDTFVKQTKAIHLKMARIRVWMMNQWLSDKPDFNKLRALHNQMFSQHKKLADLRFEFRVKGYKILGREKALDFMRGRMIRRGRWGGRFGRGPMGGWGFWHARGASRAGASN